MPKQVKLDIEDNYSGYAGSAAVRCPYCDNKIQLSQHPKTQNCGKCGSEYTVTVGFEEPPNDE